MGNFNASSPLSHTSRVPVAASYRPMTISPELIFVSIHCIGWISIRISPATHPFVGRVQFTGFASCWAATLPSPSTMWTKTFRSYLYAFIPACQINVIVNGCPASTSMAGSISYPTMVATPGTSACKGCASCGTSKSCSIASMDLLRKDSLRDVNQHHQWLLQQAQG
jgi:hypothetical protein